MSGSLETEIAAAHAQAREAWPEITVSLARFTSEVRDRLGAEPSAAKLAAMCTRDVYLAIACLDGDRGAIDRLERDYLVEVELAARKLRATDDQAAEMLGAVRKLLFTAEPPRRPALADFSGRGDLRGYIRVIATRDLIRAINRGRKELSIDPILESLDVERAPELSMLRARHGADIAEALRVAVNSLDERPRALLRYSLVDGWTVDQVGAVYGVHRATAARWIVAARDALADRVRREVATRLAIATGEVDSIVELLRSRIDVSLERIL